MINSLIQARRVDEDRKAHEKQALKARAFVHEKEKRSQAQGFRKDLGVQLTVVRECPYCGGLLTEKNAHLDHIYPVSKGGHSTKRNLIFVCAECNRQKRDSTLRNFIRSANLNETLVHGRLDRLKKDF